MLLQGTNAGHTWAAVQWVSLNGSGITSTDLSNLATAYANEWGTVFGPYLSNGFILTQITIVFIPSAGTETVGTWTGTKAGASASAIVNDASACAVIAWHVGLYYRGGHPRTYIGGLLQADVTNGSDLAGTLRTNIANGANALRGVINSYTGGNITTATLGTVSFVHNKAWRSPPIFVPFGQASVRVKLGTQRRRILS